MSALRRSFRLSFEVKVMVVVLAALVSLPAITLWLVDAQIRRQMEIDAQLALSVARDSFVRSLQIRTHALAARFRTGANEPRFLTIVRLGDAPTMQGYLKRDVLDESGDDTELALFVPIDGEVRGARRTDATITPEAFAAGVEDFIHAAMEGEERAGTVAIRGGVFHVVAIPVAPPDGLKGVLVFGIHISDPALKNIQPAGSEIVVLAGNRVAATTLPAARQDESLLAQLTRPLVSGRPEDVAASILTVENERYLPVTGTFSEVPKGESVRYVLLSSVEQRLLAYEQTRRDLLALSVLGILVAGGIVWFFVRRIASPLVDLRDNAEAVGRGDFSRRIDRISNDECGDLADAFNRMTSNLQTSRTELETAIQQVRTTQEQLIQSEKLSAVGQFVAGVAHELNNPLTAVVGFSELLQSMPTDEKTHGYLDRIAKSAHRCHKIVHSLLSFARQDAPERKRVDLHTLVEEVLEIMAYDLRTSDIAIGRELAPRLPPLMADPHQLQQVFVNILSNARQAMEPGERKGRIVIRTRESGGRVTIEFEDNGPGIRADHLARIFDPFFTTKPVGKGTGLGLSLCYGIIQEHGGAITARSELGQGATFAIELPIAGEAEGVSALERRGASAAPFPVGEGRPSGKSVLVIDDEQWILDLAGELLRAEGHAVETALGGQPALDLIAQRRFDVIISDWKMPGLNGVRLFEHLQRIRPDAAARVLFMTGDVVNDTFQDFLRKHDLACLSKPFATGEFRAAVARVFALPAAS